jgi:hypothetical protein
MVASTGSDILRQRCPRCRSGKIFHDSVFVGFPTCTNVVTVCSLRFEREEGYFLGRVYQLSVGFIAHRADCRGALSGFGLVDYQRHRLDGGVVLAAGSRDNSVSDGTIDPVIIGADAPRSSTHSRC